MITYFIAKMLFGSVYMKICIAKMLRTSLYIKYFIAKMLRIPLYIKYFIAKKLCVITRFYIIRSRCKETAYLSERPDYYVK